MNRGSRSASERPGTVRIIAGTYRSRRVSLASGAIRPTPDRVRETLFNWLQPFLPGARCLDLFAGSGILSLEAISRGATEAVLVEQDGATARHLERLIRDWGVSEARVIHDDAFGLLRKDGEPFDVVFVDPPYDINALGNLCTLLHQHGWLAPGAHIYMEWPEHSDPPSLPEGWAMDRQKQAGQVVFALARRGE